MGLPRWIWVVGVVWILAAVPRAEAQQDPHIGYIYPAGARQGTVVELSVGGQNLRGITGAFFSGSGVEARVIGYIKPLSNGQISELQDKIRELSQRNRERVAARMGGDPNMVAGPSSTNLFNVAAMALGLNLDARSYARLRQKLADPKRQPNAQLDETVTLYVTLAPDAEPGRRELRLTTGRGISNPIFFHVGQSQEHIEEESNDRTPEAVREWQPVVLNGQIMPGDVDRFRLKIAKGTRLVVAVSARKLIPYLADAVPGWFQATLALYDAEGDELAYTDDFRFDPDPVLYYEVPATGEYIVEIKDALYRGREDFVYRIEVGELPFVTSVFPLGGRAGAKTEVEFKGWNLPPTRLTIDGAGKGREIVPVAVRVKGRLSNEVPFALDMLPETLEKEPDNDRPGAQRVRLPLIVNGHMDRPGDWDVFSFDGRAGDEIVAEVHARRLGSPMDSLLELTDADGKGIMANDDHKDEGAGMITHHADSRLIAKLPADGTYLVRLRDSQHQGGPEYGYRLRIGPRRPDFQLRIVPSSISARTGSIVPIAIHALREDGFAGDITLRLKNNYWGFVLGGEWIPAGQDKVRLTLTAPQVPQKKPVDLFMEGCATIDGQEVCRPAVPAEDMMQAFAYRHLVPAEHWTVAVTGSRQSRDAPKVVGTSPVKLPAGGTAMVQVAAPQGTFGQGLKLELSDPPKGIDVKKVSADVEGLAIVLSADAKEAKVGLKGNLICNAILEREILTKDGKPTGRKSRSDLGVLPAIPFEIVAARPAGPPDPEARQAGAPPKPAP